MLLIKYPITFLLLLLLPLHSQIACTTTKVTQLDMRSEHPSSLKEGQRVRVYFTDQNGEKKLYQGKIKELTEVGLVITQELSEGESSKLSDKRSPDQEMSKHRDREIPYEQIHSIAILGTKLNKAAKVGLKVGFWILATPFILLGVLISALVQESNRSVPLQ